jgi:hypothetical protein
VCVCPDEPGYKRSEDTLPHSKQYNIEKRRSTVRAAFLDHLTHPDPYFGPLIRDKMAASWGKTRGVFEKWAAEDKGWGASIPGHIAEIEKLLLKGDAEKAK